MQMTVGGATAAPGASSDILWTEPAAEGAVDNASPPAGSGRAYSSAGAQRFRASATRRRFSEVSSVGSPSAYQEPSTHVGV